MLFYDFELSPEGQQIIANLEFVPTSKKIDTPLNKVPMKFVDAKVAIDEYDKWKSLYRQLFSIRGLAVESRRRLNHEGHEGTFRHRRHSFLRLASSCPS